MKASKILLYVSLLASIGLFTQGQKPRKAIHLYGETMATTYHINYFDEHSRSFKKAIDSLLKLVNKSINNYDTASEISRFNRATHYFKFRLPYFYPPLAKSKEVYLASSGAYDPTVMPLVNAWGFGYKKVIRPDSASIDSLRSLVGFNKITLDKDGVYKSDYRTQLDFGGIGQGYAADVIVEFLKTKGIKNMLVELGGEGMAVGTNLENGLEWNIGILNPDSDQAHQFLKATVKVKDRSFTTAGNYFNYREVDGIKYSHTIDPKTGYPATLRILSATVFAKDATTADAWDTALMAMGHERAIELLAKTPDIDAFLIYSDSLGGQKTFTTPGIAPNITIEP